MKRIPILVVLLVLGGCGSSTGGDRGDVAPVADRSKPVTKESLDTMPPEARREVEAHLRDGAAQNAMANKMHGVGTGTP